MEATIGPDSWAKATLNNIRSAQTVVQRSDRFNDLGKQLGGYPSFNYFGAIHKESQAKIGIFRPPSPHVYGLIFNSRYQRTKSKVSTREILYQ